MDRTNAKILGELLNEYVDERGLKDDFRNIDLHLLWNKVMGERIARATDRFYFKNGVAYITLSSSLIRNRLYFECEGIIASINRCAGRDIVKKIVFK